MELKQLITRVIVTALIFLNVTMIVFQLIETNPVILRSVPDTWTDPDLQPTIWVSKWLDNTKRFGFGYQLSDDSVGVIFKDTTQLIMLKNSINVQYLGKNGDQANMTVSNYPIQYQNKMKLLSYFSRYMKEHLLKTGANVAREPDPVTRTPHLHQYQYCHSTPGDQHGIYMQLSNGTVQINFVDHTKIILCPLMGAVSFIDEEKTFRTFKFSTLERKGCLDTLYDKLCFIHDKNLLVIQTERDQVPSGI